MLKKLLRRARGLLLAPVLQQTSARREAQILLSLMYEQMARQEVPLPAFSEIGFRVYSQHDEDGILLYIFSLIATTNKRLVDIGCSGVRDSNSANLITNHGWTGLLIDGDERAVRAGREFYAECPDTREWPPVLVSAFVTAENVNDLIRDHGFAGELDLLSIDLDGVDYWVWKAIDCVAPRVVVVEYQCILGPDRSLTVPYRPNFKHSDYPANRRSRDYVGASLRAFSKLARERGYRLVGCNRYCFNAFFVRSGLGEEYLPEAPIEACFSHPLAKAGMEQRYPNVKDMGWMEV